MAPLPTRGHELTIQPPRPRVRPVGAVTAATVDGGDPVRRRGPGARRRLARTPGRRPWPSRRRSATSPEASNLGRIPVLRDALDVAVGLSDHTLGIGASVAAVALGACVIEKHITL
ncbi:N-acetylneuraminate synthase family protein, partial [Nocardioides sp.]|uniref:N-acetylneuraminate synthase family protein n=1 Tax=Nocardioides sp. TaxID=35761 RepID=UPI003455B4B2